MDIKCWPMDKIMQLPDECFGRRWLVGVSFTLTDPGPKFDISEFALPDVFVIWEVVIVAVGTFSESVHVGLSLGSTLPVATAEFNALEIIFGGIAARDAEKGEIEVVPFSPTNFRNIRQPVTANGRRLVGRAIRDLGGAVGVTAVLTISSIPSEVPSWLNSAHLNNL